MAISIDSLRRVRADDPPRLLIYGPPGMGKTTLASEFPDPVFLQTEDGTPGDVELTSFGHLTSFQAVMDAISTLYTEQHEFKTLVLDSLSEMEELVWAETCARKKWGSIEDACYGKGYVEADYVWSELIDAYNALRRERRMAIVLIGHASIERFDDPTTTSYSRFDLDLHKRGRALIEREVDGIFLVKQEVMSKQEEQGFNKTRGIGIAGDQRWIYTEGRPAWTAKSRYAMPPRILFQRDAGFAALAQYIPHFATMNAEAA